MGELTKIAIKTMYYMKFLTYSLPLARCQFFRMSLQILEMGLEGFTLLGW